MTRDQAQAALSKVQAAMHEQFADPDSQPRLAQLDSHIATVAMVVDHLYDEAERK